MFTVGSGQTHFSIGAEAPVGVGGTVPPTLSMSLGPAASVRRVHPGVSSEYTASTTANVISTAGDAALTVADPGHHQRLVPARAAAAGADHAGDVDGPVSNAPVAILFKQPIGANEPPRTGNLHQTLTFTLSTTQP